MRRSERGFTLIELMVALVVSSLLVGMILAIFNRMSIAYRGQQQIAGVQQVLAAARATIEIDAKQAGLALSQGFRFANDGAAPNPRMPVRVVDSSTGPDEIYFYYADPTIQAAVTGGTFPTVNVDSTVGFAVGNLVVLSKVDTTTAGINGGDANIATYESCVLKIASIVASSPPRFTFETSLPWGRTNEDHCIATPAVGMMIYRFVARAYRIDTSTPARAAQGLLQQSQFGGLTGTAADEWTELAFGFTDIQTALQIYDKASAPGDSPDADTDPDREWYSGATQQTLTQPGATLPAGDGFLQMSISLVARTDRDVEGISTAATPALINAALPDNNTLGNHASVALPSATDPALGGSRIYRYTTFIVDLRNLGVGR
jgi:prepilin-type N-terminal cleavage/methylation domain-containing protein